MTTYKRLGDYIREVNVRNREMKVTKLVGLTIDKACKDITCRMDT